MQHVALLPGSSQEIEKQVGCDWAGIGAGVLRGSGRQHIGAYVNLVAYYVVAIPVGCLATFYFDFGVEVSAVTSLGPSLPHSPSSKFLTG